MKILMPVFAFCIFINSTQIQNNNRVVQFNISKVLNARPLTTLTNNRLVTWTNGIDGGGLSDGYLTLSAALFNGNNAPHALPDEAVFAASPSHPEVKLHYSNKDSSHNQACSIVGDGEFEFKVPKAKYKAIYIALTSAEGPSLLKIKFIYSDGMEVKDFILPDYYQDIKPGDPNLCYLAHDLAKWGNKNNMTEKDHHNIDLLNIHPDPEKTLKSVKISKTKPGYLVFWAATGVKTS